MAGQGDDGFGNYPQPDPWFSTSLNPYFGSASSQSPVPGGMPPPPHGLSGFSGAPPGSGGPNASAFPYSGYPYFGASPTQMGPAAAMTGPAHPYYQCTPPAGAHSLAEPARHSTSSMAPWDGGPSASVPPIPMSQVHSAYGKCRPQVHSDSFN